MPASTALVTGSTDGHGRRVALELARRGWRVLVHGRDPARRDAVLAQAGEGDHRLLIADLASLDGARRLAADADRADLLVNNAGVISSERRESDDGVELTFAVDYLAHVALTEALLEHGGAPRIVNVASVGAAATLRLIDDDAGTGRYFDRTRQARAHPVAYDPAERERLRALTARLLGR